MLATLGLEHLELFWKTGKDPFFDLSFFIEKTKELFLTPTLDHFYLPARGWERMRQLTR
jgi:hypothetical protein